MKREANGEASGIHRELLASEECEAFLLWIFGEVARRPPVLQNSKANAEAIRSFKACINPTPLFTSVMNNAI